VCLKRLTRVRDEVESRGRTRIDFDHDDIAGCRQNKIDAAQTDQIERTSEI
jgi:hypothetical protein